MPHIFQNSIVSKDPALQELVLVVYEKLQRVNSGLRVGFDSGKRKFTIVSTSIPVAETMEYMNIVNLALSELSNPPFPTQTLQAKHLDLTIVMQVPDGYLLSLSDFSPNEDSCYEVKISECFMRSTL